jgi:arylsulfatase A-like enzyme
MTATRLERIGMIGAWAFGTAMLTGLVHVLIASVRHFGFHDFILVSREYVWMMPAGYAIIFACVALVLALVAVAIPRTVGPRVTGFVFGSLGSLAVLLLFQRVFPLALLALALGIGSRVAAWARRDPGGRTTVMSRTGVALALAFAATGTALAAGRRWNERAEIGSLVASSPEVPNVLLIILDTVRAANVSFLGYKRETMPALARRGTEGAIFEQAHSTAPWTLPSHAGMFTGVYPLRLAADWRVPLEKNVPTVAEIFRASGYVTAGFTANHGFTGWESGLTRGFVHYDDYLVSPWQILLSTTFLQTNMARMIKADPRPFQILRAIALGDLRIRPVWINDRANAEFIAAQFLEWERSRPNRPFFAFVNMFDAHGPYISPTPWMRRFAAKPTSADRYDGAIAYLDHEVGALLDSLEKRGILDRTIVVISSDHGEELGEHGLISHGLSLYRLELHVPLIVRYPARVPRGTRVSGVISLANLGVTLTGLAGLDVPAPLPGVSLARAWSDTASLGGVAVSEVKAGIRTGPRVPVTRGPLQSIIDDDTHYIRDRNGNEELYRWRDDPGETRNLAALDSARTRLARQRLESRVMPASTSADDRLAR